MKSYIKKNLFRISRSMTLVCFTLFFSGCASVSVKSVRDPAFTDPIHKMFIILNHGQVDKIDPSFTQYLAVALKNEFSSKGVETELRVINPLSLDENAYGAEIASYKPDGVLTIVANGGVTGGNGGLLNIFYDVSLYDFGKNKRIWRAQLDASGGTDVKERRMKIMAKELVQRLSEDKLISSEPRKAGEKI
jgi:hypothetical protein